MKENNKKIKGSKDEKEKPFVLKKWWDNYLKRLNKHTKGKPQCCK